MRKKIKYHREPKRKFGKRELVKPRNLSKIKRERQIVKWSVIMIILLLSVHVYYLVVYRHEFDYWYMLNGIIFSVVEVLALYKVVGNEKFFELKLSEKVDYYIKFLGIPFLLLVMEISPLFEMIADSLYGVFLSVSTLCSYAVYHYKLKE